MSPRARGWLLIGLGFALLIGAGIAYLGPNRVVLTGEQTVAEVTESTPGDPAQITVRFVAEDGQTVEATTSRLYALPPVGAGVQIRYDADDPSDVAAEQYRESSPASTLLLIGFMVSVGAGVVVWRRAKQA